MCVKIFGNSNLRVNVKICGCFSWFETGSFYWVIGNIYQLQYRKILSTKTLAYATTTM